MLRFGVTTINTDPVVAASVRRASSRTRLRHRSKSPLVSKVEHPQVQRSGDGLMANFPTPVGTESVTRPRLNLLRDRELRQRVRVLQAVTAPAGGAD